MKKPIDSRTHGIIDYVFSGIQLLGPSLLGLDRKATKIYQTMGLGFLGLNSFTDTPVGLKKSVSFKDHQKADMGFLTGLASMTASKMINKDKRTLAFHLGFLTFAVAHYLLTDYNSNK